MRTVAGGESLLSPSITRRLIEDFCKRPPLSANLPEITQELTSRELDVLRLLARGLSNAEIAQQLYLEATTIKSHVTRLFQKLQSQMGAP